jgi:hypothetical protein
MKSLSVLQPSLMSQPMVMPVGKAVVGSLRPFASADVFFGGSKAVAPQIVEVTDYGKTRDMLQGFVKKEVDRFVKSVPKQPYNPRYYRKPSDFKALNTLLYRWEKQRNPLSPNEQQMQNLGLFLMKNHLAQIHKYWWDLPPDTTLSHPVNGQDFIRKQYLDGGTEMINWDNLNHVVGDGGQLNPSVVEAFNQKSEGTMDSSLVGVKLRPPQRPYDPTFKIGNVTQAHRQLFPMLLEALRTQALENVVAEGKESIAFLGTTLPEYLANGVGENADANRDLIANKPLEYLGILTKVYAGIVEGLGRKLASYPTHVQGLDWFKALRTVMERVDPIEQPDLFKYGSFILENEHALFVPPKREVQIHQVPEGATSDEKRLLLRHTETYNKQELGNVSIWTHNLSNLPVNGILDAEVVAAFNAKHQADLKIPSWFKSS